MLCDPWLLLLLLLFVVQKEGGRQGPLRDECPEWVGKLRRDETPWEASKAPHGVVSDVASWAELGVGAEAAASLDSRLEPWESRGEPRQGAGGGEVSREEARTLPSPQLGPQEFLPSCPARGPGLPAPWPPEGLWSISRLPGGCS